MDFEQFNNMVNMDELKEAIEEASENLERVKVPFGDYEVSVKKMVIEPCGFEGDYQGKPQLSVWFKIVAGEFKNQMIFMTKRLLSTDASKSGFIIKNTNDFLNTLESGIPASFGESFTDYAACIEEIFNAIDGRAIYHLAYTENEKGFKEYHIIKRFE